MDTRTTDARSTDAEVIVVGGGPSGLTLPGELARAGVRVCLLERRVTGVQSRAGTILPRVLELFDSRDLAERFFARARLIRDNPYVPVHIWAGMKPVHWRNLDTRFPHRLILPQNTTEEILTQDCLDLGVQMVRGATVTGLEQDEDGARLTAEMADGGERTFSARYVVGSDGGRSAVRQLCGIEFVGHDATFTGIIADIAMVAPWPEVRKVTDNHRGWVNAYPFARGDDPILRFNIVHVDSRLADKSEPVTTEEVRRVLTEILEMDLDFEEVRWASRYTDAMRLATRFRDGRVFLVGDSTRIHYPASGVGMNFCIQDAFNLGWKLAAVVQGHARPELLDSYELERRPVVEALLQSVAAQCAVQFDFSEGGIAFKRMFERDLMPLPDVNRRLALELNGLTTDYPTDPGSHRLAGRRLTDVELQTSDGLTRVGELLRGMDFLLIDLTGDDPYRTAKYGAAPVRVVSGVPTLCPAELRGVGSVLVRPDGYVAWAEDGVGDAERAETAISRWLEVAR
jgi:2-polyprenyl-6-methoxyphenol hydroxylase-like FAD-dependent oxidoreductase